MRTAATVRRPRKITPLSETRSHRFAGPAPKASAAWLRQRAKLMPDTGATWYEIGSQLGVSHTGPTHHTVPRPRPAASNP
jgi:hypothetical protein